VSTITRWSDIALVDLLSRDVEAARELVAFELGPLAARGEVAEKLREAMLAHLAAQGSHVGAAAVLGVHRNTALHRLNRAEALRGRPISERQLELHAALRLCAALGDTVIPV
jgi:DNA-binding PucR family transcriptional regulator